MTDYHDGIPEIVAKVANSTDNESVKEKWEELKTLVHLVHKDEVLRQRKKLDEWKYGMSEVSRKLSQLQQSSWGVGIDDNDFGIDYSFTGGGVSIDFDNGATSMTTTFDIDENPQLELNFPMTEEEEYANAGFTKDQIERIKQQQDPKHNQW